MAQTKQVRRRSGPGSAAGTPRTTKAPRKSTGGKSTPGSVNRTKRPRAQREYPYILSDYYMNKHVQHKILTIIYQPATQYLNTNLDAIAPGPSPFARSGDTNHPPTFYYSNFPSNDSSVKSANTSYRLHTLEK